MRNMYWTLLTTLLLSASTQAQRAPDQAWLEQAVEQTQAPAMAAMRLRSAEKPEVVAVGRRSKDAEALVGREDLWHIGSNSKAITATLVARLVEQGVLSWDDRLADVLGDKIEDIHPDWQAVSYRELLRHCSGLPANPGFLQMISLSGLDAERDAAADRLGVFASVLSQPPETAVGSEFNYSNLGYMAVGAMLEASTGQSYIQLLQEHLLTPLGMNNVGIGPPGLGSELTQPYGHVDTFLGLVAMPPGGDADNPPALTPAGRLHLSLGDYALFLQDWLDGLNGREALLQPASYEEMIRPGCSDDYAAGWGIADAGLVHNGSNTMWLARTEVRAKQDVAAVVVSNSGDVEGQIPVFRTMVCDLLGCPSDAE